MNTAAKKAFDIEIRAMKVSMYAAFCMAIVGIGFAYAANSQAILLDGLFNFLLFVMVAIGLSVSRKINQGPDEQYHFGYAGYEPFMVLVRSGAAVVLIAYSSLLAVQTMIRGGADVGGELALVYSIILGSACAAVAVYMHKAYKTTGWPAMYAEFLTWMLNGVISSAAGIALFAAEFLKSTTLEWLMPHADSIVLLVMQVIILPAPLQLLITSFQELVGKAPLEKLDSQKALEEILPEGFDIHVCRAIKQGRTEFISMDISADPATTVEQCDDIRRRWRELAKEKYPHTCAGIVFTNLASEI